MTNHQRARLTAALLQTPCKPENRYARTPDSGRHAQLPAPVQAA